MGRVREIADPPYQDIARAQVKMAISIISSWLVDDFDPKLAAWYATCRDAVLPVRHRLKQERDEKDKVMRWALWCLGELTNALIASAVERGLVSETGPMPDWLAAAHVMRERIDERIDGSLEDKFKLARKLEDVLSCYGVVPRRGNEPAAMRRWCWAF